jgi:LacI family transcriptional regulator/LacI family asc operon transcriptional repressor
LNIYDIASKAGVSIATVSRVLNGKGNVSEKTKEHVLKIIEEMGYTPNIFARGLGLNSIKMVGILCSDVSDIYYATAVSTLEKELRRGGYDSLLCCTGDNIEDRKKSIDLLISKRVDAIILVGSTFKEKSDNSHILDAAQNVPFVMINDFIDAPNIYGIVCDDFNAVRENTTILLEQGLRNIAYLYDADTYSGALKLSGFRAAFTQLNTLSNPELIVRCDHSPESAKEQAERLFRAHKVEAIVTSDDFLAIGALQAAVGAGMHIPHDIQIIGFNNSLVSRCSIPALTSVDNKVELLSITAVRTLIDVFAHKNVSNKIVLSAELVKRDTTM